MAREPSLFSYLIYSRAEGGDIDSYTMIHFPNGIWENVNAMARWFLFQRR